MTTNPVKDLITKSPKGKVLLPGGSGGRNKKFHEHSNFSKAKKEMEATGKINMNYFSNTQEVGMFLDWYNDAIKNSEEKKAQGEITEISKFLARILGRRSIVFGSKK